MLHVLVVDDSPTVHRVVGSLLREYGLRTSSAQTAEEGVRVARTDQPDLVLMDVVVPGTNGFQATRRITKDPATAQIRVVLMSVKGSDSDRIWGLRQGARDYLVKPCEASTLVSTVRRNLVTENES